MTRDRSTKEPPSARLPAPEQDRARHTRLRILDAAIQCFAQKGVVQTSTREITQRAGVTRGAYQHHFNSRENLIAAAVDHMQQRAMTGIDESIRSLFREPSPALFEAIWRQTIPDAFIVGYEMMILARHEPELAREWQYHSDRFKSHRRQVLAELFADPEDCERAMALLDVISDFFRGIKVMELVRTQQESRAVIAAAAEVLVPQLQDLAARKVRKS